MSVKFDQVWAEAVVAVCAPVFAAADVGFGARVYASEAGQGTTIFWMAHPERFFQTYPDSEVDEMFGPQWPNDVADIDFTVTVDSANELMQVEAEAWNLPTILVRGAGDGWVDGVNLARVFARLLGVDQRQFTW